MEKKPYNISSSAATTLHLAVSAATRLALLFAGFPIEAVYPNERVYGPHCDEETLLELIEEARNEWKIRRSGGNG